MKITNLTISSTLLLSCAGTAMPETTFAKNDERPNVLLVLLDDVSYDMFGCYGSTTTTTPNIDRLAQSGVCFNTAWSSALSGPARAQIMTGKYATTTGAWSNGFFIPEGGNKRRKLFDDHTSFSKELHDAGYQTAIAGKWHVGTAQLQSDPILGFDEYCMWASLKELNEYGVDSWDGGYEDKEKTKTARYWHPCIVQNGKHRPTTKNDFGPDIFSDFICDFIDRAAKKDAPFLAYYPMVLPHGPYVDMPTATSEGSNILDRWTDENFAHMIDYVDILLGKILTQLEESGAMDNTLIIFTADNGTAITAKSRGVERGCHVPFIVAGKGVKTIGKTGEICDTTDVLPTILSAAGVEVPQCDGVSLIPYVTGQSDHHKDMIHACIGGTQLLRTRDCMMEVISPILGVPEGRFYYCGDNSGGVNYQRAEDMEEHQATLKEFRKVLKTKYIGLTGDEPVFNENLGMRFMKAYLKDREKHLHNHRNYVHYDESLDD